MATKYQVKREICEIGRRIYARGYVASNDGNISYKINESEYITTPSGVSKGFMRPEMMVTVDGKGNRLSGNLDASSEIKMHLKVYEHRPDVRAVVHAHPVHATAFSVAGIPLIQCVLPEIVVMIGGAPIAQYATPSTEEVPESIVPFIHNSDALLLANHGVLTVGDTLEKAYFKLESLEHFARILLVAKQLGNINYLTEENVAALEDVRRKLGISGKAVQCKVCSGGSCER